MRSRYITLLLISLIPLEGRANDYCKSHKLGWHFYCENKKAEEKKENILNRYSSATEAISDIRAELEEKKAKAVLNPTQENMYEYIALQNEQILRAEKFSNAWKKVQWKHPELDFSVKSPHSTVGNDVTSEMRRKATQKTLQNLSNRYGIFFFYSTSCQFCQKYSSILKSFATIHNLDVFAVSMDGEILPEWPDSVINNGQAEQMGMAGKPVPATLLFDNKEKQVIPIGFGILAMSELEDRIYQLVGIIDEE